MKSKVNIIGASRLGLHWLAAFLTHENIRVQQIFSRHLSQDEVSCSVVRSWKALKPADITLICVADDELRTTINQLVHIVDETANQTFIHCAGRYSSDLLSPLADRGAFVASIHPLRAFTRQITDNRFQGCPISLEGDKEALDKIEPILQQLGAHPFMVSKHHKTLYHSACALASNGLVGLVHATNQLFTACHVDPELANHLTQSLLSASLSNCLNSSPLSGALTGPIARGDNDTVNAHLTALDTNPSLKQLYYHLSQQILSLINSEETLSDWLLK